LAFNVLNEGIQNTTVLEFTPGAVTAWAWCQTTVPSVSRTPGRPTPHQLHFRGLKRQRDFVRGVDAARQALAPFRSIAEMVVTFTLAASPAEFG
jgi:hypothetical protein